jgi:integrase
MAKIVKGEKRRRPGKWLVDYYDAFGIRRVRSFDTRREAEDFLARVIPEARQAADAPLVDPDVLVKDYVELWLRAAAPGLKPKTVANYHNCLRLHVLPTLGDRRLRRVKRTQVRTLLASKLESGFSRGSVAAIHTALRAMLSWAVDEDRVITVNPAARLGRKLNLVASKAARQQSIKAMDRAQVRTFLEAACAHPRASVRRMYSLFLCFARTGLRGGEARGLQWPDVDFQGRKLHVQRAFSDDRLDTPKSGHGRVVDVSRELAEVLRRLLHDRKAETLKRGWPELPPWVFCTPEGQPLPRPVIARAFASALRAAGLPAHFTPHGLRHTFASLLLEQGEAVQYVQEQLGHKSITLTVDTYGRWLPKRAIRGGVDGLDEPSGSKLVAAAVTPGQPTGLGDVEPIENAEAGNGREVNRPPLIAWRLA